MLGEEKNLKDTSKEPIKDTSSMPARSSGGSTQLALPWQNNFGSYTKTNKLITALYMVTDTMEKDEPIRLKLRGLGIEILSDTTSFSGGISNSLDEKISSILSFLNIASDLRMISEMNCNILKKEFMELKQSIQEFTSQNHLWFKEFVSTPSKDELLLSDKNSSFGSVRNLSKNDINGQKSFSSNKGQTTRIGVQKGSTLMNALNNVGEKHTNGHLTGDNFLVLKNERRAEIISVIKDKKMNGIEGATITDIKSGAKGSLVSCGEKTLQRELISMVKDNVLKKTGEKRWSKYYIS